MKQHLARASGPAAFLLLAAFGPAELPPEARRTLAVGTWMVLWWITEAVPLAAASLLPVALFPLLGVTTAKDAAAPYANELVFLFLAGFLLAAALEQWQSHARIAYATILTVGASARRVVLGVMLATGFISMWISNTATAAMMYPIGLALGGMLGDSADGRSARTALMLGIAYAASIGGMGTLIGTPPNLILAGSAQELAGRTLGFGEFMALGVPLVLMLLPLCWVLLVFVLFPTRLRLDADSLGIIRRRRSELGPLRGGEARVLGVFGLTALAWLLREPKALGTLRLPGLTDLAPGLSDGAIGVLGAVVLFGWWGSTREGAQRPLLTWAEAKEIPWDVLLLFGGGLSLAAAMETSGLTAWFGGKLSGLAGQPAPLIALGLALTVLFLSELASNTAVAAMAMPLAAGLARAVGQPPLFLMLVAGFAASTGFALPIATPPNAIVFGSGQVSVRQMLTAGLLLDLIAVVVIVCWLSFKAG